MNLKARPAIWALLLIFAWCGALHANTDLLDPNDPELSELESVDPDEGWNEEDSKDPFHYSISDKIKIIKDRDTHFLEPQGWVQRAKKLILTNFLEKKGPIKSPSEKYDRNHHFGKWLKDPNQGSCLNTRAQVLVRQSRVPVTFKEDNPCTVAKGEWADPFSGRVFTNASDIQIDHFVPLKNAYSTGAWKWEQKTRCLFANFLENRYHLMAVSGDENMRKGDKSPDKWMPSNTSFSCSYLNIWLKIKLVWNLNLSASEALFIKDTLQDLGCAPSKFTMTESELRRLRASIAENYPQCL